MPLSFREPEYHPPVARLGFVALAALIVILLLVGRLWAVQVLATDRYELLAEETRLREAVLHATRGAILDRSGELLADSRPAPAVLVDRDHLLGPTGEPDEAATVVLDRLAGLLDVDAESLHDRLRSDRYLHWETVPVAVDVPLERWFAVAEHGHVLPGVDTTLLPVRDYPNGTTAAHVLGYLGEISEAQLAAPEHEGRIAGELAGQSGLEQAWEQWLAGVPGQRVVEVTAQGRLAAEVEGREPVQGNDLHTTLDLELQRATEEALEAGLELARHVPYDGRQPSAPAGAAVVLDPRGGAILAMASSPAFEPARFVGGVDADHWDELHDPDNHVPLFNRAIAATYPPGSTFKLHLATSALEQGQVGPTSRRECPPAYHVGRDYHNWNDQHEGRLDVAEALMRSCNTWFYPLAHEQWIADERRVASGDEPVEPVQEMSARMGLGRPLAVDLPGEDPGAVPGRTWMRDEWDRNHHSWCARAYDEDASSQTRRHYRELCEEGFQFRVHEAINLAIGQGKVVASPLQLAASYATIANGGTLWRPHLGQRVTAPDGEVLHEVEPEPLAELGLDNDQLAALQRGLELVVAGRGTARGAFAGFPLDEVSVAGKTGTATVPGDRVPTSWFVGYAPADDPRYVVAVAVEDAGGGSRVAAPITRRILEVAHGFEVTPFLHETTSSG
jgi:penicillin-binding protein 2